MNFKPICTDFEKRYGVKCTTSYFVGKPVIFIKTSSLTIGTAVSCGGFLTAAPRTDDKILIQFSDSDEMLNCNLSELSENQDEKLFSLLLKMQQRGARLSGCQLLLSNISSLKTPAPLLLLCAANAFLKTPQRPQEFLPHFNNFEQNMLASFSRQNTAQIIQGSTVTYLPLPDETLKIVLCYPSHSTESRKTTLNTSANEISEERISAEVSDALNRCDFKDFGKILTRYNAQISRKKGAARKAQHLFELAKQLDDAYGSGYMPDGGIYSLVQNNRVDTFMHNLRFEYERTLGGKIEFYVTRSEDSVISYEPQN